MVGLASSGQSNHDESSIWMWPVYVKWMCVCLVKPLESSIIDLTLEWIEIFEVIDV